MGNVLDSYPSNNFKCDILEFQYLWGFLRPPPKKKYSLAQHVILFIPFKLRSFVLSIKKHLSLKYGVISTKGILISNFKCCFFQVTFYVAYSLEASQYSWNSNHFRFTEVNLLVVDYTIKRAIARVHKEIYVRQDSKD